MEIKTNDGPSFERDYFEEHSEWSATYYDKEEAMKWYEYHCDKKSRFTTKIVAQNG